MHVVRNCALLPGPGRIWESDWIGVFPAAVCAEEVCCWHCSVGVLVKWVAFFLVWCTLHWPAVGADLGVGGVSHVEMIIFV